MARSLCILVGALNMQENEELQKQNGKMEDKCNQWVNYHSREVFYLSTVTEHAQIVHKHKCP